MVPASILRRVFMIKIGSDFGTAFTIELKGLQYLVTAKHVLSNIKNDLAVEVNHENSWQQLQIERIWYATAPRDLAILFLKERISPQFDNTVMDEPYLSQDVYFLGFPYGQTINVKKLNSGFPIPYVKKGIISGYGDDESQPDIIILDAINNKGFSGGPVISIGANNIPNIFGVINSFQFTPEFVFNGDQQTILTTHANTGLTHCTSLKSAIDHLNAI